MRSFDMTPLFRSTIGFDRMARALEAAAYSEEASYPPYNIEKTDDNAYRLTMAVAGFTEADLDIQVQDQSLTVKGGARADSEAEEAERRFLHRGIARRSFERRFQLADHVEVEGAVLENGLLHVDLRRVIPEALKPRQIAIRSAETGNRPTIEHKQAA